VEVVDPRLQRHGEVDEIVAPRSEHDGLGPSNPAQSREGREREREREQSENKGRDRDPPGGRGRDVHFGAWWPRRYSKLKITGYSTVLLAVFSSPGTGVTATFILVGTVNSRLAKSRKVAVFV
jgi:hypothetical protein